MKNYKIKPSFVRPEGPKARANKTSINIMIFILIFVKNCLYSNDMNDFSVWLRRGSNPVNINWFRSHPLISDIFVTDIFSVIHHHDIKNHKLESFLEIFQN